MTTPIDAEPLREVIVGGRSAAASGCAGRRKRRDCSERMRGARRHRLQR
jgi:hypothetical protein